MFSDIDNLQSYYALCIEEACLHWQASCQQRRCAHNGGQKDKSLANRYIYDMANTGHIIILSSSTVELEEEAKILTGWKVQVKEKALLLGQVSPLKPATLKIRCTLVSFCSTTSLGAGELGATVPSVYLLYRTHSTWGLHQVPYTSAHAFSHQRCLD